MKILWANAYCLMDTSSGASISASQMLRQMARKGVEVRILGATNFDSPRGATVLEKLKDAMDKHGVINAKEGELTHTLVATKSHRVDEMTSGELSRWFDVYRRMLDEFKPDVVFLYGGKAHDMLTLLEAKHLGIPTAFYLVNGNYHGDRWYRDVDLVLTDSRATAGLYEGRANIAPVAVGTFIDPIKFVSEKHTRERLVFINPSVTKGARIVVQIARLLEQKRPDIPIEVVESRGSWSDVVRSLSPSLGIESAELSNVTVTPNTDDMRTIFGRARVLLQPSVWWESGARVLAEAMLNGIPAIVTNHGGSMEMIGNGGFGIELPEPCYEKPYDKLPGPALIEAVVDVIVRLFDDEVFYQQYVTSAVEAGRRLHNMERNTTKLIEVFESLRQGRDVDGARDPASRSNLG